jgi:hypothetical protein
MTHVKFLQNVDRGPKLSQPALAEF